MRILVTNDDGIASPGLLALVKWAMTLGEVTVVAPKYEQSGKSQTIEIIKPFEVAPYKFLDGVEAYAVDSSPADCVRFAIRGLGRSYDLVLSGINRGFNIGGDIMYSGTVAAAFEAGFLGHKAISLSADPTSTAPAIAEFDHIYRYMKDNNLFAFNDIYNVNIPLEPKGIRITRQGGPYYLDDFVDCGKNFYRQDGKIVYSYGENLDLDTDCVMNQYCSISPLSIERTNKEVFQRLFSLNRIHGE